MPNTIVLMKNGDEVGTLTTSSSVIIIDIDSILLDGGVRMNTSNDVGMVYNDETNNVVYLNAQFATKNQRNPIVKNYLSEITSRLK